MELTKSEWARAGCLLFFHQSSIQIENLIDWIDWKRAAQPTNRTAANHQSQLISLICWLIDGWTVLLGAKRSTKQNNPINPFSKNWLELFLLMWLRSAVDFIHQTNQKLEVFSLFSSFNQLYFYNIWLNSRIQSKSSIYFFFFGLVGQINEDSSAVMAAAPQQTNQRSKPSIVFIFLNKLTLLFINQLGRCSSFLFSEQWMSKGHEVESMNFIDGAELTCARGALAPITRQPLSFNTAASTQTHQFHWFIFIDCLVDEREIDWLFIKGNKLIL